MKLVGIPFMATEKHSSDRVEHLFSEALTRSGMERTRWLDEACQEDVTLRGRVERLLASHAQAGEFLAGPATDLIDASPAELSQVFDTSTDSRIKDTLVGEVIERVWVETFCDSDQFPSSDERQIAGMLERMQWFAPSDDPSSLGRLGECEILEMIGRGGMGVVYRAMDTRLQRQVAIKILHPLAAVDESASRRFLREAQAAAAVTHDHVVVIHDVAEIQGLPYLVMQYMDGGSLQDKITGGGLSLHSITQWGMQIAQGLAAAHKRGMIHRDIKPANILLERDTQQVRITDFGLACVLDESGLTETGRVTGTPHYMSPEQAQDQAVDARSDLFSLGCVLYALCAGRSPFEGSSTMASLRAVCDRPHRSLHESHPHLPPWLVKLIDQLLAKDPKQRPSSAREVAEVLREHWLAQILNEDGDDIERRASRGRVLHRYRVPSGRRSLVGLVALLGVLGTAAWQSPRLVRVWSGNETPAVVGIPSTLVRPTLAAPWIDEVAWSEPENLGPMVNSAGDESQPFLSADGLSLVFDSNRPGGYGANDLWECRRKSPVENWEPAQNLGSVVNTMYDDGNPCLTTDRLTLYFTSTREGGHGQYDLWMTRRSQVGAPWQEPVNLGSQVNSDQLDGGPSLSADELTLWFHSYQSNVEGSDIWFCQRARRDEPFGPAQNAGPLVNTPGSLGESSCAIAADGTLLIWTQCVSINPTRFQLRAAIRKVPTGPFTMSIPLNGSFNDRSPTAPWISADGQTLLFEAGEPDGFGGSDLWVSRRVKKP